MKKTLGALIIFMMVSALSIQTHAKNVVIEQGGTVLGALKQESCQRAWLAQVLADNDLTMQSARRIQPKTTIKLPNNCENKAPVLVQKTTKQLLGRKVSEDTNPQALLGMKKGESLDKTKKIKQPKAEEKQKEEPAIAGSSSNAITKIGFLLLGASLVVLTLMISNTIHARNHVSVPKEITTRDNNNNKVVLPVTGYEDGKVTVTCPHCPKPLIMPLAQAKDCIRKHVQSGEHPDFTLEFIGPATV